MKMYPDMELVINQDFPHMSVDIYGQVMRDGRLFILGYDGEQYLEQEITRENEMCSLKVFKPLLRMNRFMFDGFVKAFLEYAPGADMQDCCERCVYFELLNGLPKGYCFGLPPDATPGGSMTTREVKPSRRACSLFRPLPVGEAPAVKVKTHPDTPGDAAKAARAGRQGSQGR